MIRKSAKEVKKKVNLAVIGISGRGAGMLQLLLEMEDVNIIGVSDCYEDRLKAAVDAVVKAGQKKPAASTDYRDILNIKDLDGIFTPSSWTSHVQICLDAMNAGVYASTEVGGATSIQQCWELVRTSERTGKPCMLMENCCYGREEMTVLNMISKGLLVNLSMQRAATGMICGMRSASDISSVITGWIIICTATGMYIPLTMWAPSANILISTGATV